MLYLPRLKGKKSREHASMLPNFAKYDSSNDGDPAEQMNDYSNYRLGKLPVLMLLFLTFVLLNVISIQAHAANWYVRPSGGSGSGTSWLAAWNNLNGINWSKVSAGDTIWVAGGTYTGSLSPTKSGLSQSRIYIRRAREDAPECTSASGWSSSFNSEVIQTNSSIHYSGPYSYITVSGATTASGGTQGWRIYHTTTNTQAIRWSNDVKSSNTRHEYINMQGPGHTALDDASRGIQILGVGDNHTFSHCNIYGFGNGVYVGWTSGFVFEYGSIHDIWPTNIGKPIHPQQMYIRAPNGIIRYSKFFDSDGEGIAFSDGGPFENWQIYGNVFHGNNKGSGTKTISGQDAAIAGLKIYNNTFVNNRSNLVFSNSGCGAGSESKNNLVFGSGGSVSCGKSSNNISIASTPDPFVGRTGNNYRIVSNTGGSYPRNAGTPLAAIYSTDMHGILRGSDGTWDVGAYEYTSGSTVEIKPPVTAPLQSPSNVRVLNPE